MGLRAPPHTPPGAMIFSPGGNNFWWKKIFRVKICVAAPLPPTSIVAQNQGPGTEAHFSNPPSPSLEQFSGPPVYTTPVPLYSVLHEYPQTPLVYTLQEVGTEAVPPQNPPSPSEGGHGVSRRSHVPPGTALPPLLSTPCPAVSTPCRRAQDSVACSVSRCVPIPRRMRGLQNVPPNPKSAGPCVARDANPPQETVGTPPFTTVPGVAPSTQPPSALRQSPSLADQSASVTCRLQANRHRRHIVRRRLGTTKRTSRPLLRAVPVCKYEGTEGEALGLPKEGPCKIAARLRVLGHAPRAPRTGSLKGKTCERGPPTRARFKKGGAEFLEAKKNYCAVEIFWSGLTGPRRRQRKCSLAEGPEESLAQSFKRGPAVGGYESGNGR